MMTQYEIFSIVVSSIAILVSVIAMIRTRKVNTAMLRLEEVHAELSKRQINIIEKEEDTQEKADIKVELVQYDNSSYKFVFTNIGYSSAKNITVGLTQDCEGNPLVMGEYKEKNPYPLLNPGDSFTLIAAITMGMKSYIFPMNLHWQNENGSQGKKTCAPSL